MRISDKRKSALYEAISEPVMNLRIELAQAGLIDTEDGLDNNLFQLSLEQWREVCKALDIDEP